MWGDACEVLSWFLAHGKCSIKFHSVLLVLLMEMTSARKIK